MLTTVHVNNVEYKNNHQSRLKKIKRMKVSSLLLTLLAVSSCEASTSTVTAVTTKQICTSTTVLAWAGITIINV